MSRDRSGYCLGLSSGSEEIRGRGVGSLVFFFIFVGWVA